MNKYLHYCAHVLLGTLLGFALGYGFRCREIGVLKRENSKLVGCLSPDSDSESNEKTL